LTTSTSPSTDPSLLRLVQDRDESAWRAFADLYGPLIYAWCRRAGLAREDAADVMQDAFLAVARGVAAFRPAGPGALRAWLWAVTMNKVRDHFRRAPGGAAVGGTDMQARLAHLPDTPPDSRSDQAAGRDLAALVHRGLAQVQAEFEPRTWRVFCLAVLEGRDTASVAAELGLTANYVRQVKSRVLRRLRETLGDVLP
jgi:RNA polymerase sigma-70 factor (ECF subfamily)